MDENCNAENVIYQAEVTTSTTKETYIGLCDTTFKLRYRNHMCSFRNERYKHATELSKHIWSLKDQKIAYQIKWWKIKQARSYSNVSKRCNLCLWENFFILQQTSENASFHLSINISLNLIPSIKFLTVTH